MKIELLTPQHLQDLPRLQPEGWTSIRPYYEFYLSSPFCYPIAVVEDGKLIGVAAAIIHGKTAWLAHIIVDAEQRNRGIGKLITEHLVDWLGQRSCETILLIATTLGAAVYKKVGFETEGEYFFYKREEVGLATSIGVFPYSSKHFNAVLELDRKVSGEERRHLLTPHLDNCWIVGNEKNIEGFYMPTLGDGLIISSIPGAAEELMRKRMERETKSVLPQENKHGIDFLLKNNFQFFITGARMRLGKKILWQPTMLYNRIGGNLG